MKVFFTPVIDGMFSKAGQVRMPDMDDSKAYALIVSLVGKDQAEESMGRDGYIKIKSLDASGRVTGYHTYQENSL